MELSLHPISKAALIELKHTTFPEKKRFKTLHSMDKLLMAFFNGWGIFLLEFLDHGAAVNAYHCCTILWHRGSCVDGTSWFDHRGSDSVTMLLSCSPILKSQPRIIFVGNMFTLQMNVKCPDL
jgi:hypothetical protein